MDSSTIQRAIAQLNDIELAALVCLVAEQHCIIRADDASLSKIQSELEISCAHVFGLSCASINCDPATTLDDFSEAIVQSSSTNNTSKENSDNKLGIDIEYTADGLQNVLDSRKVANVVIARNLNQASEVVQIQALELMRSGRIYSKTAAHTIPKRFLFIVLISSSLLGPPYLNPYLNDHFFISHTHNQTSTPPYSNPASETASLSSQSSITRQTPQERNKVLISPAVLANLRSKLTQVRLSAEMRRYIHNLVTFLRLHRAVAGGVSAVSSRHLTLLARVLAPLHGMNFVSPSLVALAALKVYPHRIEITAPENERSMMWGSNLEAVTELLKEASPDTVLEEVLTAVNVPL